MTTTSGQTHGGSRIANTTDTGYETGGRYASIETGDGDVVIYDLEEPAAWLQSDYTVEIRP